MSVRADVSCQEVIARVRKQVACLVGANKNRLWMTKGNQKCDGISFEKVSTVGTLPVASVGVGVRQYG